MPPPILKDETPGFAVSHCGKCIFFHRNFKDSEAGVCRVDPPENGEYEPVNDSTLSCSRGKPISKILNEENDT
jgi:hypothetical protein